VEGTSQNDSSGKKARNDKGVPRFSARLMFLTGTNMQKLHIWQRVEGIIELPS